MFVLRCYKRPRESVSTPGLWAEIFHDVRCVDGCMWNEPVEEIHHHKETPQLLCSRRMWEITDSIDFGG